MHPRLALPAAIDPRVLDGHDRAARIAALGGETMGTRWRVLVAIPPGGEPADSLRAAIVARLDGLVAEMSHWRPDSLLARFNAAPAGSAIALPPDFARVMTQAFAIAAASDGAFDPAAGHLVDLWGYGPPGPAPLPAVAAIDRARRAGGWHRLGWDAARARLVQPGGVALDLSGIAKGDAADALADLLAARGLRHALVEVGGELVGRGIRPDGEPWWVDLETPPGLALPPLRVALHNLAVATSGSYLRGPHTLDPRTGHPAGHGVVAASVIAPNAAAADAWATALTVLGSDAALPRADAHGLAARLITVRDGQPREWLSSALQAMLAG